MPQASSLGASPAHAFDPIDFEILWNRRHHDRRGGLRNRWSAFAKPGCFVATTTLAKPQSGKKSCQL